MLVASTTTSASSAIPDGRASGIITPVDVSLWVSAYTSMPSSADGSEWVPAGASTFDGSPRCGAAADAAKNFDENSPNTQCWLRSRIRPNVAASQK